MSIARQIETSLISRSLHASAGHIARCCAILLLVVTAGCGLVPKDGPEGIQVRAQARIKVPDTTGSLSYALIRASPRVLAAANTYSHNSEPTLMRLAGGRGTRDVRIAVGDILALTIFEASSGGLFIPKEAGSRSGNYVQIPNEQVDASGSIDVPYAGSVQVAGKTAKQVSAEISRRLEGRAIEPQAVVSITERRGNDISVLGDVGLPARFSLDPGGIRVLSAVAKAGGPKSPAYETSLLIQRGGETARARLSSVIRDPRQNLFLTSGDTVYLSHDPRVFLVLGATLSPGSIGGTNNRRFAFDNDEMTLSEATAKAGGLDTNRADPRAVYLYRLEPRDVVGQMGVDLGRYPTALVPTIYAFDFSRGDAFFMANAFLMRDKDVVFVSESPAADLQKLTAILGGLTSNAAAAYTLR